MTTAYKKHIEFANVANVYLGAGDVPAAIREAEASRRTQSKLGYALRKVSKKQVSVLEDYNEKLTDLRVEHAKTGEDGTLQVTESGNYKYTPDADKKLRQDIKALRNKEIAVQGLAYFASEVPEDLAPDFVDAFVGFAIDPSWINEDGDLIKFSRGEENKTATQKEK